jgi:alkylation response protein AidB-like acyl-CoA dehydrogenase
MDFEITAAQADMRAALRDMLASACPPQVVRRAWQPSLTKDVVSGVLNQLAAIGALGVLAPHELGGLGGDEVDLAVVMEEIGRFAVPGPLTEHVAIGVPALASGKQALAAQAAAGDVIVTALDPSRGRASHARLATACVLIDDVAVSPPGGWQASTDADVVDWSQPSAEIELWVREPLPDVDAATAVERAVLAVAAQLIGLASHAIDLTVGYVKERRQFGAPVGKQQAVKHAIASALIAVEHAQPVVYRAAYARAHQEPDAARAVSFAKVYAYRAAHLAARTALQCHGAIGYSWDYDLHMWIKRIWSLSPAWGTVAEHERQVADSILRHA